MRNLNDFRVAHVPSSADGFAKSVSISCIWSFNLSRAGALTCRAGLGFLGLSCSMTKLSAARKNRTLEAKGDPDGSSP